VPALEQRIDRLEQNVRQLESERAKTANDESERRAKLERCVAEANAAYDQSLARNGTKTGKGLYSVPITVSAEMQSQKQSKIEECKLLYSK
jgi:septal ring factor EnvC (AmiA/AmiB activator)